MYWICRLMLLKELGSDWSCPCWSEMLFARGFELLQGPVDDCGPSLKARCSLQKVLGGSHQNHNLSLHSWESRSFWIKVL